MFFAYLLLICLLSFLDLDLLLKSILSGLYRVHPYLLRLVGHFRRGLHTPILRVTIGIMNYYLNLSNVK